MVVLAIVVIICNIRPALFSYGLHATLLIVSILGVMSFYIIDIFIEFILDTDIKNTLFWQLRSPQYWILVILFFTVDCVVHCSHLRCLCHCHPFYAVQ